MAKYTEEQKKAAHLELVRRELAKRSEPIRSSFSEYVKQYHEKEKKKTFYWTWFHERMYTEINSLMNSNTTELLMINIPPRHGKTSVCTLMCPTFLLGHNPDYEIISTSYSSKLSQDFSGQARDITKSDFFRFVFPWFEVHPTQNTKEYWKTHKGGGYYATGSGGSITGKGADLFIIDDPIKPEDAIMGTQTELQKVNEWFKNTVYSRLNVRGSRRGKILIIMQRLHDDDLCGHILRKHPEKFARGEYKHLVLPAIAVSDDEYRKQGEALFPEMFDLPKLHAMRDVMQTEGGANYFAAQYQQEPIDFENQEIRSDYFKYFTDQDHDTTRMPTIIALDPAVSEKQTADLRALACVSVSNTQEYFVNDCQSGRWNTTETIDRTFAMQAAYKCPVVIESVGAQEFLAQMIEKEMKERGQYFSLIRIKSRGEKLARIRSTLQPLYQSHRVYHHERVRHTELEKELLRFPKSIHDDCMDATETAISNLSKSSVPVRSNANRKSSRELIAEYERLRTFS